MNKLLCGSGFHSLGYNSRNGISDHMTTQFKHWETSGMFFMVAIVLHIAINSVRGVLFLYNPINKYSWRILSNSSLPIFCVLSCFVF